MQKIPAAVSLARDSPTDSLRNRHYGKCLGKPVLHFQCKYTSAQLLCIGNCLFPCHIRIDNDKLIPSIPCTESFRFLHQITDCICDTYQTPVSFLMSVIIIIFLKIINIEYFHRNRNIILLRIGKHLFCIIIQTEPVCHTRQRILLGTLL